jgi:predicted ferric reductase
LGLVKILPLDQHIGLHKLTGILIFFQAWFHAIMHFLNFGQY